MLPDSPVGGGASVRETRDASSPGLVRQATPEPDALAVPESRRCAAPALPSHCFEKVSTRPLPGGGRQPPRASSSSRRSIPIGTFNDYTDYQRQARSPSIPTPGRRALTTHQRTHTVDHIPDKGSPTATSPWIPYMHVGEAHPQLLPHALVADGARPNGPEFLPAELAGGGPRPRTTNGKRSFDNLWLLSRGPMSQRLHARERGAHLGVSAD